MKKALSLCLALCMLLSLLVFPPALAEDTFVTTIVNDTTLGSGLNQFTFYGPWGTDTGYPQYYYNGDAHWSNSGNWGSVGGATGVYFTVRFYGNRVQIYGDLQPNLGIAAVLIDGVEIGRADLYAATNTRGVMLFDSGEIPLGEHLLKFAATGTKNPSAGRPDLLVDYLKVFTPYYTVDEVKLLTQDNLTLTVGSTLTPAFDVLPTYASDKTLTYSVNDTSKATVNANGTLTAVAPGSVTLTATNAESGKSATCNVNIVAATDLTTKDYDDTSIGAGVNQFQYSNWNGWDKELSPATYSIYKGTGHYGTNASSSYEFKFEGQQVELFGKRAAAMAILDIYIDDVFTSRCYATNSSTQWGASFYTSPLLSEGVHTIRVQNSGLPAAGTEIYIDRARVSYTPKSAEGYSLPAKIALLPGETMTLYPVAAPKASAVTAAVWTSADETVATVSASGVITAVATGKTVISGGDLYPNVEVEVLGGPPTTWLTTDINDTNIGTDMNQFTYAPAWTASTNANYFGGSVRTLRASSWPDGDVSAAFAELKFEGARFYLYGVKSLAGGVFDVYIDGDYYGPVDQYASTTQNNVLLYTSPVLGHGVHTVKLQPTIEKNETLAATNANKTRFDIILGGARINHNPIPLEAIALPKAEMKLEVGSDYDFSVITTPSHASDKSVIWSCDNPDVLSIVNGKATALATGTAVVTATSASNASLKASCVVTVIPVQPLSGMFADPGRHYGVIDGTDGTAKPNDYDNLMGQVLEAEPRFEGTGWRNDTVITQLLLLSKASPVTGIAMQVGDLTNVADSSAVIDKSFVSVSAMDYTRASLIRASYGPPYQFFADIINYPGLLRSSMPKTSVQALWCSIDIPKDAKPGVYEGVVTITADGGQPMEFTFSIEVLDLVLTDTKDNPFHLDFWQYPYTAARYYNVTPWSDEHFKYLEESMKMYQNAGGKTITATIIENPWGDSSHVQQTLDAYPSMVKWTKKTDGSFAFDFSVFDRWVQFCLDLGFNKQISCYSIVPWNNRLIYYDEALGRDVTINPTPGSANWNTPWSQFMPAFVAHLDEKGWFDMAYIAMDERGINDMRAAMNLIQSCPNKNGKTLKLSGAMNYSSMDTSVLDGIADISVGFTHIASGFKEFIQARREKGLNTTIYACTGMYPNSFTYSYPVESAWLIWSTLKYDTDGFMRWAYDAWVEDPLKITDHWYWESGDAFQIYPAAPGSYKPRAGAPLEMFRQGIRDVEKLKILKRLAPELASDIDALSADILYSPTREQILASMAVKRAKMYDLSRAYLSTLSISVTLDPGMDGGTPVQVDAQYGADFTVPACDFTYAGNLFMGWQASGAATGIYKPGDVIPALTSGLTLTAVWGETVKSLKLKVPANLAIKRATTYNLAASLEVTPANAVTNLVFASSNSAVANVSDKGVIQAVRTGTVVITVKDSITGTSAAVLVTVS